MKLPPIIVSPVDPECRLSAEECEALRKKIEGADTGDVVVLPVPVEIHVLVDGYWIPSDQLARFHSGAPTPDDEPGETAGDEVDDD